MARLVDPEILGQFKAVLENWAYRDYITAKPTAHNWGSKNLPERLDIRWPGRVRL